MVVGKKKKEKKSNQAPQITLLRAELRWAAEIRLWSGDRSHLLRQRVEPFIVGILLLMRSMFKWKITVWEVANSDTASNYSNAVILYQQKMLIYMLSSLQAVIPVLPLYLIFVILCFPVHLCAFGWSPVSSKSVGILLIFDGARQNQWIIGVGELFFFFFFFF